MVEKQLEDQVLMHRYLYYVKDSPVISDYVYDQIERDARAVCKEDSPVHGVGSSLASSYPPYIIQMAEDKLL